MTRSFQQSPLKAFRQSPLKARGVGATGQFIFQVLFADRFRHNTDTSPWGAFPGQNKDANFPDIIDAVFTPKPASGGATFEYWGETITPPSTDAVLSRGGFPFNTIPVNPNTLDPAFKVPGGWNIDIGGSPHTYSKLVCIRCGVDFSGGDFGGTTYAPDIWEDCYQKMRLHEPTKGIATFHTIPFDPGVQFNFGSASLAWSGGITGTVSIPAPDRTVSRSVGDSISEFIPDPPDNSVWNAGAGGVFPSFDSLGTVSICIFWFDLTLDTLPSFPYSLDSSAL